MSSELIVMTFRHRNEAETVLKAIRAMRKSPILSLDSVVVATRDRKGKRTFRLRQEPADAQEDRDARILLSIAELILCPHPKGPIDALADRGMDARFVTEVARITEVESSALFFLTSENSVRDASEMRSTLALFKGTIHQTSLSPEVEAYLSK
jgi:uncharacterized membrane protein